MSFHRICLTPFYFWLCVKQYICLFVSYVVYIWHLSVLYYVSINIFIYLSFFHCIYLTTFYCRLCVVQYICLFVFLSSYIFDTFLFLIMRRAIYLSICLSFIVYIWQLSFPDYVSRNIFVDLSFFHRIYWTPFFSRLYVEQYICLFVFLSLYIFDTFLF